MKTLLMLIFCFLFCPFVNAKDLQHFNPEVFGCSSNEPVRLLCGKISDDIEPILVQVDIKDGIFFAATIQYPNVLSFEEARESLNKNIKNMKANIFQKSNYVIGG